MKFSTITESQTSNGREPMEELRQALEDIRRKLENEILAKQVTIDRQEKEVQNLWVVIEEKTKVIAEQNEKLYECIRNNEGNRQLINKLLGDINRLNHDIEWYKKTYEKRSFIGYIKQKIFKNNL